MGTGKDGTWGYKRVRWCLFSTFGDPPVDYITALFRSLMTLGQVPGKTCDL